MGDVNKDQSMEDILASIKRVIETDGRIQPVMAADRSPLPGGDDVLELRDPVSEADAIMSQDRADASRNALAALAGVNQAGSGSVSASSTDGPLEAVVRDMLRPLLKQWLDDRLPAMVEDLVTREIARITGKSL